MSDDVLLLILTTTMLGIGVLRAWRVLANMEAALTIGWSAPDGVEVAARCGVGSPFLRPRYCVPPLALLCAAGLAYGGHWWYQTLGRIHETHTVDEYGFTFTSERDPEYAEEGYSGENIAITIRHKGKVIAKRLHIGSIADRTPPPTFTVRRLPNESLIIVTRNDREHHVAFTYDMATGESCPSRDNQTGKVYDQRRAHFEARIRACLRDERYNLWPIYYS
jgi:hypothetical protein